MRAELFVMKRPQLSIMGTDCVAAILSNIKCGKAMSTVCVFLGSFWTHSCVANGLESRYAYYVCGENN